MTASHIFLPGTAGFLRTLPVTLLTLFPTELMAVNLYAFPDSALICFSGTAFGNCPLRKKAFVSYMPEPAGEGQ